MSSTSAQRALQPAHHRLKVLAEADPGAIARVLQPFQSRNIVPHRVRIDRIGEDYLEIAVDVATADIQPDALQRIAAQLGQLPDVMVAITCD